MRIATTDLSTLSDFPGQRFQVLHFTKRGKPGHITTLTRWRQPFIRAFGALALS